MADLEQQMRQALRNDDQPEIDRLAVLLDAEDEARDARLAAPGALAAAAGWYASQGIPIFPLRPRLKTPATRSGFKDATTDPDQIHTWWQATPNANIGAPTGLLFDVVDIDGPEGRRTLLDLSDRAYEQLYTDAIGIVKTPRTGGIHYYVPSQAGRRNSARKLPGIDTRAEGGYVLLPPSITDAHGADRRYEWVRPLQRR